METPNSKVLISGLDGATFDLIKPWVAEGRLPNFKRLLGEAVWGELDVELPPGTVPNWPSFATGKNPGKHGLIWWTKPDPDNNDYTIVSSKDLRGQTLWDIAGSAGLKVGVVNVPVTYPAHPVNGLLITGLLTPPDDPHFTYPENLKDELAREVGEYQVFPGVLPRKGNEQAYLDELHRTLDRRFETVKYLLENKPWQLFTVVFGATDWVMHAFWKHHDPAHPNHKPEEGKQFGHAIQSIYEHADKVVGELLAVVDENTTVIIMSDHGAGPAIARSMLNNWLMKIGLLKIKNAPLSRLKFLAWRLGFTPENLYPLVQRLGFLTMRVKKKVDPRRMGRKSLVRRVFLSYNDVDWARTKAFTMGGMGQIYVNVKGRHAQGCVEPGEEYDRVIDTITTRLPEIKLPNSNQSFVKTAFRRDDLYHGGNVENMPDIVIFPTDMGYLDLGVEFASNQLFTKIDAVSGGHRTNGVFVLTGAKVKGGQELKGVSIRDIAPTALHLLGLPIPDDMDGRVLTEALEATFLTENPIKMISAAEVAEKTAQNGFSSDEDEARIRERLAGLGYLD